MPAYLTRRRKTKPTPNPLPLNSPSQLVATGTTTGFSLTWNAVTGATSYPIEISTNGSDWSAQATVSTNGYNVTGFSAGVTRYFRVAAARTGETSGYSNTAQATVQTPVVSGPGVLTSFESISIEHPVAGGSSASTCSCEWSDDDGDTYHTYQALDYKTDSSGWQAFVGKIRRVQPGTAYKIRLTTTGVTGAGVTVLDAQTRSEDITARGSLSPTHYIAANGVNTGAGGSGAPWLTPTYAIQRWADTAGTNHWVVQCGPGTFTVNNPTIPAGKLGTITFTAQNPAVNSDREEINVGTQTIFQNGTQTVPAGGSWQAAQYEGPISETTYDVWEYTGPLNPTSVCWSETANGEQFQLARMNNNLKMDGVALTEAGHVEVLFEGDRWNYGGFQSKTNPKKFILRMPPNAPSDDPNDLYMHVGADILTISANGEKSGGSTTRFSGIRFRGGNSSVTVTGGAKYPVFDYCLFDGMKYGINLKELGTTSLTYAEQPVVEYCRFQNRNLVAQDDDDVGDIIPWTAIKGGTTLYGSKLGTRTFQNNEGNGIYGAGGRTMVVRHCTFSGVFNGQGADNGQVNRYKWYGLDLHDCFFQYIADEMLGENEPKCMNDAFWYNRGEYCGVFTSIAPGDYGPHYYEYNEFYEWGSSRHNPMISNPDDSGVTPLFIKTDGNHLVTPTCYFFHNTCYTSQAGVYKPILTVTQQGSSGVSEIQTISCTDTPMVQRFKLEVAPPGKSGVNTSEITTAGATAAIVEAAIEAIPSTTGGVTTFPYNGTITVTGGPLPATPIVVTFNASFGNVNTMIVKGSTEQTTTWPRIMQNVGTGATGRTRPNITLKNNLFVLMGRYSKVLWGGANNAAMIDENYNAYAAPDGIEFNDTQYTTIAAYRTAASEGANSNKVGTAGADVEVTNTTAMKALMTDPDNGDLTPLGTSGGVINRGVVLDIHTIDSYSGAAPDIGRWEKA
jgi:hypothetical protein